MRRLFTLLAFGLALSAAICHDDSATDGAVVRFSHRAAPGEDFVAATTDTAVLRAVRAELALPEDQRRLHINGALQRAGSGDNLQWRWRFAPNQWALAEISTEVCDGTPSMVERDIDNWVDNVKRFCPWRSYVKAIESDSAR